METGRSEDMQQNAPVSTCGVKMRRFILAVEIPLRERDPDSQ